MKKTVDPKKKKTTARPVKTAKQTTVIAEKKPVPTTAAAKAGKRSAKSLRTAEELAAKERRKKAARERPEAKAAKPVAPKPTIRPIHARKGKRYQEIYKKLHAEEKLQLSEAITKIISAKSAKFTESVEMHLRLNVDPKEGDQNIRDTIVLPHSFIKEKVVAVYAQNEKHAGAKSAGADIVMEDDFLVQLKAGDTNFDVLISTPQMMGKLGQFAKLLGPKGLMPSPKNGTVTNDVAEAVKEVKRGKFEYRVDPLGNLHVVIGKTEFQPQQLIDNAEALLKQLKANKPPSVKGALIISAHLATTMGPSVAFDA